MLDSSHSVAMFQELDKGALIHYRDRVLTHKNTQFRVLTGFTEYFTVQPLISIGSSPLTREIISLDPENSPLLQQKYDQFSGASFEELVAYIRARIFHIKTSERLMDAFIFEWIERHTPEDFTLTSDNRYLPVIPLDDFIRSGVGVCRHSALTAAYFINRLIQDGRLPPGRSAMSATRSNLGAMPGSSISPKTRRTSGTSTPISPSSSTAAPTLKASIRSMAKKQSIDSSIGSKGGP